MNVKNMSLVIILSVVFSAGSFAQNRPPRGGNQEPPKMEIPSTKQIEKMVSNLASEISLNEEQEAEVLELYKDHFEKVESKTKSGRPDRDEMKALKEGFENDIKELLTDDQKELYTTYLEKNSSKKRGKKNK